MDTMGKSASALTSQEFTRVVLDAAPQVAAFDCDGTLWSGDAGETFFDWEIRSGVVSAELGRAMRARYAEYKAGQVTEDDMCSEMVTMHKGKTDAFMMQVATDFMEEHFPGKVFPEMLALVQRLHERGCEI